MKIALYTRLSERGSCWRFLGGAVRFGHCVQLVRLVSRSGSALQPSGGLQFSFQVYHETNRYWFFRISTLQGGEHIPNDSRTIQVFCRRFRVFYTYYPPISSFYLFEVLNFVKILCDTNEFQISSSYFS